MFHKSLKAAVWSPTNGINAMNFLISYISLMNQNFPVECSQFFTATIFEWNHLLADEKHKNIIVDFYCSARFYEDGKNDFGMLKHFNRS